MAAASDDLAHYLSESRLAGWVQTSPGETIRNCGKLVDGRDDYTFGLSLWRQVTLPEAISAVRSACGGDPEASPDPDGPGWIDPGKAAAAIRRQRDRLAAFRRGGGGRVLIATGHPTGLLGHYAALARALQASGSELLAPLDDVHTNIGGARGVRFIDGVACVFDGGALLHTHLSWFMEAMLDELGERPDLVVADHGMAGAAIERGVPTLSIADVNDPALFVAEVRGITDAVLPIDDNLAPRLFVPVTATMLAEPPR